MSYETSFAYNRVLPKQGKDKWIWGIFLKERQEELIGLVDLWRSGTPENRGFWLGRKYWNRGIMSEAVEPVMDFAFDVLDFSVRVFSNAKGNTRSRRIKEKTGARLVRVEPGSFVDPEYTESEICESLTLNPVLVFPRKPFSTAGGVLRAGCW